MDINLEQREICQKYGSPCIEISDLFKVGIAKNFSADNWPINGLRHPMKNDTTGWYIWAGKDFSTNDDFFEPIHVAHLHKMCPIIIKYLGLAPGWRFLITESYEDVWEDDNLLNVD